MKFAQESVEQSTITTTTKIRTKRVYFRLQNEKNICTTYEFSEL